MAVNDNTSLTLVNVFCRYGEFRRDAGFGDSTANLHITPQGIEFELRSRGEHAELLNFLSYVAHMDEAFFHELQGTGYAITGQTERKLRLVAKNG